MTLQTTILGRTGVEVTRLGYGAMELRGSGDGLSGPRLPGAEVDRLLNAVLDAGINVIDTSPDYGEAEERIGRSISHRRNEFLLASKCGCPIGQPPPPAGEPMGLSQYALQKWFGISGDWTVLFAGVALVFNLVFYPEGIAGATFAKKAAKRRMKAQGIESSSPFDRARRSLSREARPADAEILAVGDPGGAASEPPSSLVSDK